MLGFCRPLQTSIWPACKRTEGAGRKPLLTTMLLKGISCSRSTRFAGGYEREACETRLGVCVCMCVCVCTDSMQFTSINTRERERERERKNVTHRSLCKSGSSMDAYAVYPNQHTLICTLNCVCSHKTIRSYPAAPSPVRPSPHPILHPLLYPPLQAQSL